MSISNESTHSSNLSTTTSMALVQLDKTLRKRKSGWDTNKAETIEDKEIKKRTDVYRGIASRIYISNISINTTDIQLREYFNTIGTIIKVERIKSNNYCFIEYSNPAYAAEAVKLLNNTILNGNKIEVSRSDKAPSKLTSELVNKEDVMRMLEHPKLEHLKKIPGMVDMLIRKPDLARTLLLQAEHEDSGAERENEEGKRKLYIGSVYLDVTVELLRSIFEVFGKIKSCTLVANPETGKHKGYGFIEYTTAREAEQACINMNNFELCGRKLKINIVGPQIAKATSYTSEINLASGPASVEQFIAQAKALTSSLGGNVLLNSTVLVLGNMILPTELDDEFEEEVKDEVEQYGTIKKIVVHFDDLCNNQEEAVKTYVHYATLESAIKARKYIDKHWFNGKLVKCNFYSEEKFLAGKY